MAKKFKKDQLVQMRKAIEKQEKLIAMGCNHQKKNGDLDVKWVSQEEGIVKCKICDSQFSMAVLSYKDLEKSFHTLNSAIQQIRASTTDDEDDLVENYGKIAYALSQIPEEYTRLIEVLGKNKKKKKKGGKKNNNIGGYGNALEVVRRNRGR